MKAYQVLGLLTALLAAPVCSTGSKAPPTGVGAPLLVQLPPPAPPPPPPPPAPPAPPGALPLSTYPIVHPAPRYPGMSIYRGEHGRVRLLIQVQADGTPARIRVEASSGYRLLDRAASDAVRQWRFPVDGGRYPGQPWYARVPVSFNANADMLDRPDFWGPDYPNPHYVRASTPFPFADVRSAYEAMVSHYGRKADGNMMAYPIRDTKHVPLELWLFLDLDSAHAIALHFVRGGTLPAPSVAMSALCNDGVAMCESRMSELLNGPPFAREHYANRTLFGPGDGMTGNSEQ